MSYALITGASSGIGRACALEFAKNNLDVILLARRKEQLDELAHEIESKFKVKTIVLDCDVTDYESLRLKLESIKDFNVEVLVNNAGLALGKSSFQDSEIEDLHTMIDVNVKGFVNVARLMAKQIMANAGHVFNVSSIAGIESYEGGHVYCGTKAFVKAMSKGMRIDFAGSGVRVTDIAPCKVDTEFSTVRFHGDREKADSEYIGYTPLYAKDIAACVIGAWLLPKSVNVEYMLVMPTAQASATRVVKKSEFRTKNLELRT